MAKKKLEYFYLFSKEEAAMKVLWDTEDALSASEIAKRIPIIHTEYFKKAGTEKCNQSSCHHKIRKIIRQAFPPCFIIQ